LARRVTAYLLETIPIQLAASVASGPAIAAAIRHYSPWSRSEGELIGASTSLAVGAACSLAWFLARDAIPGASWGKYLLGLRVVSAQPGVEHEPPALHARLLRNLGF